ncbi:hypothetical protein Taro_056203 [Colocasia esculenta]|uniref:Uncharacterized protein n=1 Tax=Colocasia esculenta TaxID=4460 RepID=A0A843XVW8_COLES|nr:hypothetical protein [Colocasia esculenta]
MVELLRGMVSAVSPTDANTRTLPPPSHFCFLFFVVARRADPSKRKKGYRNSGGGKPCRRSILLLLHPAVRVAAEPDLFCIVKEHLLQMTNWKGNRADASYVPK